MARCKDPSNRQSGDVAESGLRYDEIIERIRCAGGLAGRFAPSGRQENGGWNQKQAANDALKVSPANVC
jgi:hypothetical protein